ncbi:MAG: hypothetical protein IPK81_15725 [Rhodospirillales bacterium]|nr:MAG: hypothetical protein IPK81_15725 [Rhodospirillales bacterium]
MVLPHFRVAAFGSVICGMIAGPDSMRAQSVAALSAIGFPIVFGSAIDVSDLRSRRGGAVRGAGRDAAATLSMVGAWSVSAVSADGAAAVISLVDGGGTLRADVRLPARVVRTAKLRIGDSLRTVAAESGIVLHKNGDVVAFVARDEFGRAA